MKNIVIVGASSGIGEALLNQLKSEGHHVFTLSRRDVPQSAAHYTWDVTGDVPTLNGLPETLHGLVYAPGTINLKPFNRIKIEDFTKDLEVNVLGAVRIIQALLPNLKAGNASVVLFSTVAATMGMPFHASIATAKGAVEGLTRSLAAELAPHIRVNALAPSLTQTPLAERLLNTPEKLSNAQQRHPLNRVGDPNKIAHWVSFLLSENADFVTGQVLGYDGGMSTLKA